jgi:hypothetical protein
MRKVQLAKFEAGHFITVTVTLDLLIISSVYLLNECIS